MPLLAHPLQHKLSGRRGPGPSHGTLELTEGSMSPVACLSPGAEACPNRENCRTLPMWKRFDGMVHDFFYGMTLKDLMEEDGKESST